jgi:hypothetical protein
MNKYIQWFMDSFVHLIYLFTVCSYAENFLAERPYVLAFIKILKLSSIITYASTYYL